MHVINISIDAPDTYPLTGQAVQYREARPSSTSQSFRKLLMQSWLGVPEFSQREGIPAGDSPFCGPILPNVDTLVEKLPVFAICAFSKPIAESVFPDPLIHPNLFILDYLTPPPQAV
ncbi:hypothetical protein [Spirosoma sp. KUDC1026]|uniref:hypothetical protein n=1 Tax=Spirosoma sp. KUDC1026 TaxID=2745947 RepID=UPI00159BA67D|nr:hypothetical protein [Spirosoma sp. KUDC1026]QKZ13470.1 hypothetical protein HU175_12835 [Spirosoma sp. KUDC1026]